MIKAVEVIQEVTGTRITRVAEIDTKLVFILDSGKYLSLKSVCGYEGDRDCPEPATLDNPADYVSQPEAKMLMDLGIWDDNDLAQWTTIWGERDERARKQAEERERAHYERLKAKYGDR